MSCVGLCLSTASACHAAAEYSRTLLDRTRRFLEGEDLARGPPSAVQEAVALQTSEWIDEALGPGPSSALNGAEASSSSSSSRDNDSGGSTSSNDTVGVKVSSSSRSLVEALDAAHRGTQLPGSTTACVARLNAAAGELEVANLGDSGLLLFRDGELIFQTPVLQHFWDCPLQFGEYARAGVMGGGGAQRR